MPAPPIRMPQQGLPRSSRLPNRPYMSPDPINPPPRTSPLPIPHSFLVFGRPQLHLAFGRMSPPPSLIIVGAAARNGCAQDCESDGERDKERKRDPERERERERERGYYINAKKPVRSRPPGSARVPPGAGSRRAPGLVSTRVLTFPTMQNKSLEPCEV